eukprot:2038505-Pleurochrysis_carterae.AAC.1
MCPISTSHTTHPFNVWRLLRRSNELAAFLVRATGFALHGSSKGVLPKKVNGYDHIKVLVVTALPPLIVEVCRRSYGGLVIKQNALKRPKLGSGQPLEQLATL